MDSSDWSEYKITIYFILHNTLEFEEEAVALRPPTGSVHSLSLAKERTSKSWAMRFVL